MTESGTRNNPLIVTAAIAVILTCLLAIGVMTGLVPSPLTRDRVEIDAKIETPAEPEANTTARPNLSDNRAGFTNNLTNTAPPRVARERERAPAPQRERVGSTRSVAPQQQVAGGTAPAPAPAPRVAAICENCGSVTSVRAVTRQGEAGVVGPLAGSAIGGLVGSQIGGGSGKAAATIIGAAGGAAIGTEIERRQRSTTSYVVSVRLNDGTTRSFTYASPPGYEPGDRVRVVDGRLIRDS